MKEYKIKKIWFILLFIAAVLLIPLFIYVAFLPFMEKPISILMLCILEPVSILMIMLMVFALIEAYKMRLIIYDDKFVSIGLFRKRELKRTEIKGYRFISDYLIIEPNSKNKPRIKISKYLKDFDEILNLFAETYTFLSKSDIENEQKEILNNENFGSTMELRNDKLSFAKKISKLCNYLGGAIFLWALFYPKPYDYAVFSVFALPLIAIVLIKLFKGLIRIDEPSGGSAYPSVAIAFLLPSIGLMTRVLFDYDIFDYSTAWWKAGVLALIISVILFFKHNEFNLKNKHHLLSVLCLLLFIYVYSFAAVIYINCNFDNSKPEYFTAKIIDKRISKGKRSSYYLKITPWGEQKEASEVSVSKSFYNRMKINEKLNIYFKKGKLAVPWFILTDE